MFENKEFPLPISYSYFNDSIGFALATFNECPLTVTTARIIDINKAKMK